MGFWTQERDDHLLALKAQNISAAEIAAKLGGDLTRNAVLGRLHRIGIKAGKLVKKRVLKKHKALVAAYKPPTGAKVSNWVVSHKILDGENPTLDIPYRAFTEMNRRRSRFVATEAERMISAAPLNLTMVDLEANSCRWPVNDPPPRGEHLFCGHPKRFGSYCAAHAERSVGIGTRSEALADRMPTKRAA